MGKHYFTFCGNQDLGGRVQIIEAGDSGKAREKMFEAYGEKWGFQYTEEQWEAMRKDPNRRWEMEVPLEDVLMGEA